MSVIFTETDHKYTSIDGSIEYVSVTTVIGALHEKFDKDTKSISSSKNSRSKWYKIPPDTILKAWENENKRAIELGKKYHEKKEQQLLKIGIADGVPVIKPIIENGIKQAPEQRLTDGIYPEHLIYIDSIGICGQSDIVKVHKGIVTIRDYKTSKEIATAGFKNWEGTTKKMLPPVHHLEDCHINHYALQLSIYMYGILRLNPSLQAGDMYIDHVKFKEAGRDQYDYPIAYLDENGEPVVEEVIEIKAPYMKLEVQKIIEWIKNPDNRNSIKKH